MKKKTMSLTHENSDSDVPQTSISLSLSTLSCNIDKQKIDIQIRYTTQKGNSEHPSKRKETDALNYLLLLSTKIESSSGKHRSSEVSISSS